MRIYVYVDAFNLYYGTLKNTPYKWLDISKLCHFLFPKDNIDKIKYFTARISIRPNDSDTDKPTRQQVYFRALSTIPNLEIIEGSFLVNKVRMKKADYSGTVEVIKTEEKGTDVNIASHLIHDGYKKSFDLAVVISNDSDLVEPIRIVTKELNLPIIVVSPFKSISGKLKSVASSVKKIRSGVLSVSQFPDTLKDTVGDFNKPSNW